ncbi:hypothetical protein [Andreprevotia chitinilytica]|uniref:hypothetical protein n=1 Tax=Andreprevotia chitinilytica TaxID=396808 RepID=UPI00054DE388|nr:hypothetical protein [Andreprevotia chitinilytica]
MALTIMIWNTQHFDNQTQDESEAYQQKKGFLLKYLQQVDIDIFTLFETGKTGNVNASLINDLKSAYTAVAILQQEGGKKKHSTLGSIVFVKNGLAKQYEDASETYILSDNEQRAPLLLKHKESGYCFAFYHANASYNASKNIVDTITFIQDNLDNLELKGLLFFGGDLNVPVQSAYKEIKGLQLLAPTDPGYTHVSITNKTMEGVTSELNDQQTLGNYANYKPKDYMQEYMFNQGIEEFVLQESLSLLDYAYVHSLSEWKAKCHGSIQKKENQDYETIEIKRICCGMEIRSDHFPVLFTLV